MNNEGWINKRNVELLFGREQSPASQERRREDIDFAWNRTNIRAGHTQNDRAEPRFFVYAL